MRLNFTFRLLVLILGFVIVAAAQSPTATVSGIVLDPAGRAIVRAEVLIVNDATGVKYQSSTNGEGIYAIPNLPPGPYRLQVSKIGFATLIKPDIILNVQDALAINFTLPIGAISETITVAGGAPLVNTQSAAVSTVIDRNFVETLPLNGRSFNTLLQLTPGVVIAPSGAAANGSPGQFSIAGQRTSSNNLTVDGVSANFGISPSFGSIGSGTGTAQAFSVLGGTSSLVSVDALQEFRIETSSFAPEFGRSPGGQILLTTRAGTNEFHGGVFDYFRNTIMDASNWFNGAHNPPLPKAPEHHNDFGGFLGGPIYKDRTFFFASYEGARLSQPQSVVFQVPSAYARSQAPTALAPFLNAFPQPNGQPTSPTAFIAPFTGSFSNGATLDAGSLRLDHTFNNHLVVFGRYNKAPSSLQNLNVTIPSNPQSVTSDTQTLTLGANMSLSTQLANAFRANYSAQKSGSVYSQDSFGGAVPLPPGLLQGGLPSASSSASFLTFDTFKQYTVGAIATNRTKQLNIVDDLSRTIGAHQLKFGGDYRAIYLDLKPYQNQLNFSVSSIQNFLSTGQVNLFAQTVKPSQFVSRAFSLYGQDNWRLTPRLTLTYGLRWELSPAPSARGTTSLAAWRNTDNFAQLAQAPSGTELWETTFGNFAPRIGIAYSLTEKGDFVIRAGGGVFYDLGAGPVAQLGVTFPNAATSFVPGVTLPLSNPTNYLPVLSQQAPFPTGTEGYASDLSLPRSYQWNVALEKSFADRQAFTITYVGQAGRELLREEASYRPTSDFAGVFLLWHNAATSNYNALQLQYRRPLSSRLQALLNYTWSHSLDNASNDAVAGFSGTVISAAQDYASSDFDIRHSFSGAATYSVPGVPGNRALNLLTKDWAMNAVVAIRTGFPFNATLLSGAPVAGGYVRSRPDLVPGVPVWISSPTAAGGKSLNAAAFVAPSTIRQGSEGRNDIPGFGLTQVDLSFGRKFPLPERINLEFRTDAFNVFNHPNFSNPPALLGLGPAYLQSGTMLNQSLGGLNALFQQGGPRSLQVSLKLTF